MDTSILHGELKMINLLLSLGIPIDSVSGCGMTALMYACESGYKVVAMFLIGCSHLNVFLRDDKGNSALSYACQNGLVDCIKMLLDVGDDVHEVNHSGVTLLMRAI
jgi:ankyrin repeat protein